MTVSVHMEKALSGELGGALFAYSARNDYHYHIGQFPLILARELKNKLGGSP